MNARHLGGEVILRRAASSHDYGKLCKKKHSSGDLEEVLFHRCKSLLQQQDLIRGLTDFHWWTQIGV
ncbi:hypothetical protein SD80_008535 [Scytonema tolypothrichoides VB-61278]|nr:hypothetical protein SD80_008535 [Scytonema tolypothrichoides VB-61278]